MSSIIGNRYNYEQGQSNPQLIGGAQPIATTKPQLEAEKGAATGPTPQGGERIPWAGGGRVCVAGLY